LQIVADVFQAEVTTFKIANSSALGGALRAAEAVGGIPFARLYEQFAATDASTRARPSVPSNTYDELRARFATEVDALVARG
jgi:sugar (pentulose or hexulose) kinase